MSSEPPARPEAQPGAPAVPEPVEHAAQPALPLLRLSEPLAGVVQTSAGVRDVVERLRHGAGPIALDAERASGHRYSQRAYLLQLRREGSGTALVDPVFPDDPVAGLDPLARVLAGPEWILHAATQDLPCLAEIGMRPRRLFDTELAARLLDLPRVGLASLVEDLLGFRLAKEHSAVDWSTRPLPEPWLEYAALDVEVMLELRGLLAQRLDEAGKRQWAEEEFSALLTFTGPAPRIEPWRRTSGVHRVRGRRALAAVRELWLTRDSIAAHQDVSPGRVLADATIVEAAKAMPRGRVAVRALPGMRHRQGRRHLHDWTSALERAAAMREADLPAVAPPQDGPPPPRSWPDRDPSAAARLAACRAVVTALAGQHKVPAENLVPPDAVRRLAWQPPHPVRVAAVQEAMAAAGARPWQIGLTAGPLTDALAPSTG